MVGSSGAGQESLLTGFVRMACAPADSPARGRMISTTACPVATVAARDRESPKTPRPDPTRPFPSPIIAAAGPDRQRQDRGVDRTGAADSPRWRVRPRRLDAGLPRHVHRHRPAEQSRTRRERHTTCAVSSIPAPADFTVRDWLDEAERGHRSIRDRGSHPILVGGTNLYIRALLEGVFDGPGPERCRSARNSRTCPTARRSTDRLVLVDPPSAARIHRNDRSPAGARPRGPCAPPVSPLSDHKQQEWADAPRGRPDARLVVLDRPVDSLESPDQRQGQGDARGRPPRGSASDSRSDGGLGTQAREAVGYRETPESPGGTLLARGCRPSRSRSGPGGTASNSGPGFDDSRRSPAPIRLEPEAASRARSSPGTPSRRLLESRLRSGARDNFPSSKIAQSAARNPVLEASKRAVFRFGLDEHPHSQSFNAAPPAGRIRMGRLASATSVRPPTPPGAATPTAPDVDRRSTSHGQEEDHQEVHRQEDDVQEDGEGGDQEDDDQEEDLHEDHQEDVEEDLELQDALGGRQAAGDRGEPGQGEDDQPLSRAGFRGDRLRRPRPGPAEQGPEGLEAAGARRRSRQRLRPDLRGPRRPRRRPSPISRRPPRAPRRSGSRPTSTGKARRSRGTSPTSSASSPDEAKRVVFNAITKSEIARAFEKPRAIDEYKVNAQQARRILDRIVGYQASPLLWKKVARGLSAGRVQSVATRLIVEREREIDAFIPDESWEVGVKLALDPATAPAARRRMVRVHARPSTTRARARPSSARTPGSPTIGACGPSSWRSAEAGSRSAARPTRSRISPPR